MKKLAELEQRLLDLLLCNGLDLFEDYILQANTVLGIAAEDSFVDGYRHGVQCLLDALEVEIEVTEEGLDKQPLPLCNVWAARKMVDAVAAKKFDITFTNQIFDGTSITAILII